MQRGELETLIYLLAFLKVLVLGLIVRRHLRTFPACLLALPKLSNLYPTQTAYRLITSLLSSKSDAIDADEARETVSYVLGRAHRQSKTPDLRHTGSLAVSLPTPSSSPGMALNSHSPSPPYGLATFASDASTANFPAPDWPTHRPRQ